MYTKILNECIAINRLTNMKIDKKQSRELWNRDENNKQQNEKKKL